MRVLYVEDDLSVAKAVEAMLASESFECDTTDSGKRAVDLAKSNRYDVILLDLRLPDIDGYEVIKRLREAGVRTPFLMQTGVTDQDNQLGGRPFGVTEYLVKPFNKTDLIDRVQAVLSRPKLSPMRDFVSEPGTDGATQVRTDDRRSHERIESIQPGKILHKEGIDCLILNLSDGGAAIELPDPDMPCPPAFDLQLPSGAILRGRLCWRFRDKLGVKGQIVGIQDDKAKAGEQPAIAEAAVLAPSEPATEAAAPCRTDQAGHPDGQEPSPPAADLEPPAQASTDGAREADPAKDQARATPCARPDDNGALEEETFTIARGVRLSAESCECAEVLVGGHFESAVKAKRLRVEAGGRFAGKAVVERAEIAGSFHGDLIVHGRLTILATGTVAGRTQCPEMVVELGGFIAGQVQRPATRAPAAENPNHTPSIRAPSNEMSTVA